MLEVAAGRRQEQSEQVRMLQETTARIGERAGAGGREQLEVEQLQQADARGSLAYP